MLKSFFKIAFRNLLRSKGFAGINIFGLAFGIASAMLILLWINNEVSYDRFHANKDNIYEAWNRGIADGKIDCWDITSRLLGPTLKLEHPQIQEVSRMYYQWFITRAGEKKMSSRALLADGSFLGMFSLPLLKGNAATALDGIYDMVVTEKMAVKMFGNTDVLGKVINIDKDNFTITGVLKDLPVNTQFDFEYLLPWAFAEKSIGTEPNWDNNSTMTYVQVKPGTNLALLNTQVKDIVRKHSNGATQEEIFLYPLTKRRLFGNFENGQQSGGRITVVITFGIIAAFILLIACINFMNLSTARSEKRAKEVGIRKVAGAIRLSLILQFLFESMIIVFLSSVLALLLVHLALPFFNDLVGKPLTIPYGSGYFWLAATLFIIVTGTIAGSYPAFYLSAFAPVVVLKGLFKRSQASVNPRKVLVVLQFTFAILLIVSTVVVTRQMQYAQERETGYGRGHMVYHYLSGDLRQNYELVKKELLASGAALSITRTWSPLTEIWDNTWNLKWPGKSPDDKTIFDVYSADEGLATTAGLSVVQGRDFDLRGFPTDSTAVLLNESAVKAMKYTSPVGRNVYSGGKTWHIVGVIKDFVIRSPYEPTYPMVIYGSSYGFNLLNIKMNAANSTAQNMRTIEKIFRRYNPSYPFEYHFPDDDYALKFEDTKKTAKLIAVFAFLTIVISSLGLFGLAAYMAENRTKEIGIRKVLGASVGSIVQLLSKEFLQLVVVAFIIACPIAWLVMHSWLQNYAYRIGISWWIFAVAGLLSLSVALSTISVQAIRAALMNPVKSLKNE